MMIFFRSMTLGAAVALFVHASAFAEKRVALVIGNSAYQSVGRLANPANDAAAITKTLQYAGFDTVDSKRDLSTVEMRKTLRDFANKSRDADVAVVYYAGHGIEVDGTNYLIPVDAQLETDTDVLDETFPLDRILVAIEPAKKLRLVILDACRDNPFAKSMKRTFGSRAVGRGLAKVEPSSPNTMIAFAAKAGSTASDGDNGNSPFAAALVNHLTKPGLDLRKAFGFVRDDVLRATANKQEPFVYGSLGGNDVSLVPSTTIAPDVGRPSTSTTPAASNSQNADARRDYELALSVNTTDVWDAFIADYPRGLYTALAKAQRSKVAAEVARVAATDRAKAAEVEKARLLAEGARAADQAKANALAKAAEEAKLAAEKKKAAEVAKVAEAERAKASAQAKAEEAARIIAEKKKAAEDAKSAEAETIKSLAAAKAGGAAKVADEKAVSNGRPVGLQSALVPTEYSLDPEAKSDQPTPITIPRLLQMELRRVGCNSGVIEDTWTPGAQKSLAIFNKYAGMKLDLKVASLDSLEAIKSKTSRICPLICDFGFKADGERCSKIVCRSGYEISDDNECERVERKNNTSKLPREIKREKPQQTKPVQAASPASKAAIYAICNKRHTGNGFFYRVEACVASGGKDF